MNSRAINVAAAAVALLNAASTAGDFAPFTFTATRAYRPNYDLTALANLTVTVIPQSLETAPHRRILWEQVGIDVSLQQTVSAAAEVSACDALMELVEQIKQQLEAPGALLLSDAPTDCGWQGTTNDPIFDPDALQNSELFQSVMTFTYLTRRVR